MTTELPQTDDQARRDGSALERPVKPLDPKRDPVAYAEWLADKLHNGGDFGKEAAALLVNQAKEVERMREALEVYADPSFYHACSFLFDRPTGGFDEDFDYDEDYGREMPGKLAREALRLNVRGNADPTAPRTPE